ncbi:MAG: hypothetical protein PHH70_05270 [Candidatus Gracilibacteria bacterium]|nr:hypothetical protein [Candidatus Gracilibacteria bacterium]
MQTNIQNKENNQKQMISLVLLCLSILIGFFFTMDQGYSYIEKKDALAMSETEVSDKKGALEKLQDLKKKIESNIELQNDIERYGANFREDVIYNSIFAPINGVNISSVSLGKGEKDPNGLSVASISVSLKAQDITALNNFLEYLTNGKTNKKSYVIKSLNFPLDTTKNDPIAASLELNMYFFE